MAVFWGYAGTSPGAKAETRKSQTMCVLRGVTPGLLVDYILCLLAFCRSKCAHRLVKETGEKVRTQQKNYMTSTEVLMFPFFRLICLFVFFFTDVLFSCLN